MMEVQRLDMNRVVAQVQAMLTRVIGAQVRLTTSLDPQLPNVEADPGQLEQVLVNLAINARDAMPDGGTLHITTSVEEVTRGLQPDAARPLRLRRRWRTRAPA